MGEELTLLQVVISSLWLMEILPDWTGFQGFPRYQLHFTHLEGKQQRGMDSGVCFGVFFFGASLKVTQQILSPILLPDQNSVR